MSVAYTTFGDILEDVLFRSGESPSGSEYEDQAKRYILRGYASILNGDDDLLADLRVPEWSWLRKTGVITLDGSSITDGKYFLPNDVDTLSTVIFTSRQEPILLVSYDDIERGRAAAEFLGSLTDVPTRVAVVRNIQDDSGLEQPDELWFNTNGPKNEFIPINFTYRKLVLLDTWSDDGVPDMPAQYRKVLADYALYFLFLDKDDDRVNGLGHLTQNTVRKMMLKENLKNTPPNSPLAFQLVGPGRRFNDNIVRQGYTDTRLGSR